ncbi:hypothetical protein AB0425_23110 [Actinosynnema sp. NPDC051121]
MLREIAEATEDFLVLLDDGQRAAAVGSMADDLRTRWATWSGAGQWSP